ncbi:MAG: hypothetical protein FDZ70_07090 [Actinobacteria bacterium]|nr:MAG: hypothetical protein FDZ70_07090 [Actinomycetota bacterium]
MRPRLTSLLDHLMGSRSRAAVIRVLYAPRAGDERLWFRQIGRAARVGMGQLYEQLQWLEHLGLLRMRREGGALFIEARTDLPLGAALEALVRAAADYE